MQLSSPRSVDTCHCFYFNVSLHDTNNLLFFSESSFPVDATIQANAAARNRVNQLRCFMVTNLYSETLQFSCQTCAVVIAFTCHGRVEHVYTLHVLCFQGQLGVVVFSQRIRIKKHVHSHTGTRQRYVFSHLEKNNCTYSCHVLSVCVCWCWLQQCV